LILLSASLAFSGCSCDDGDQPHAGHDGGHDSGTFDANMDDADTTDANTEDANTADANTMDAAPDATADASSDDDAGYDAGPGPRNACGGEMCDLLSSTSCTTSGEGCKYQLPVDPLVVIPFAQCGVSGSVPEGGACTTASDCAPGLDCSAEGSAGSCRNYCCNLNQKSGCPGEQACVIEFTDDNGGATGVGLCDDCDACNPLDSAGTCNGNAGCYPIPGSNGRTFSDCTLCLASTQNLAVGERCRSVNDCVAGSGCFRLNNRPPVCVEMCDHLRLLADPPGRNELAGGARAPRRRTEHRCARGGTRGES
jgi:hypothetical protein